MPGKMSVMKRKITAYSAAGALALAFCTGIYAPQEAKAQLIGPCPSPLMPPPCIIFDYKKLADLAREHANQLQKLKDMAEQAKQTAENAKSIGGSIASVQRLQSAGVAIGEGDTFSDMARDSMQSTVQTFSNSLYGGEALGADGYSNVVDKRNEEDVRANVDAYATALTANTLVNQSHKRLVCLGRASTKTTDLRQDWAINSQVKLEMTRIEAQKSHLLTVYMENAAVDLAVNSRLDQPQGVVLGRTNSAPAVPSRSPAWDMQSELARIEGLIRTTLAALSIARGSDTVRTDAAAVQARYENLDNAREQALANFRRGALRWDSRRANSIVDITLSELNRMDSSMAALRERPISQLGGAFRDRNIDADAMMQNDVDPRQFIGTWGDPLKNKNTLDMANGLLDGRLDDWIDGDDDNDEYRDLLLAYNEARLEEAWMRNYASEAAKVSDNINAIVSQESEDLGYDLTAANAQKRLEDLVAQANALGQQIQQTGEDVPTQRAARSLDAINRLLNGQNTSPAPSQPGAPNVVPTTAPEEPELPNPRDPRNPGWPPVNPQ
tara:strand:- start:715 stop:2376 length:1662 start_codon:yes stop_codon:yes gene_type:complete